MTMFDIYVLLALIVIGMALLLIVSTYFTNKKKNDKPPVIGTIVIETSDPDGPFFIFRLGGSGRENRSASRSCMQSRYKRSSWKRIRVRVRDNNSSLYEMSSNVERRHNGQHRRKAR